MPCSPTPDPPSDCMYSRVKSNLFASNDDMGKPPRRLNSLGVYFHLYWVKNIVGAASFSVLILYSTLFPQGIRKRPRHYNPLPKPAQSGFRRGEVRRGEPQGDDPLGVPPSGVFTRKSLYSGRIWASLLKFLASSARRAVKRSRLSSVMLLTSAWAKHQKSMSSPCTRVEFCSLGMYTRV